MEHREASNESKLEALQQQLEHAGIDVSEWGKGQAKTLAHLQKEIDNGETSLVTNEHGELMRKVIVGCADILYRSPDGKKYRLKEDKQVFKDGRERRRNLAQGVSEKMKPDEDPKDTMVRGVREELGVEGELSLTETGTNEQTLYSPSYPGLQSQYVRYEFEATLNDQQFKPDGYVEEQEDKSTYFVWVAVE